MTQNMAHFLPYVLKNVEGLADEIVVVDSFSTDDTVQVVSGHAKVKLFQRAFQGHFGEQKNFAIDQATSDWVLVVDSDEILGDRALAKIPALIRSAKYTHYKFSRYWIVDGPPWQYVRTDAHYPDFQLRLFRNDPFFRYRADKVVHTHFSRDGRGAGKKLRDCHIFHFDFILKDRSARQEKYERYIALEPDSSSTSKMYLFEDFQYDQRRCREKMSSVEIDQDIIRRLTGSSSHLPDRPASRVQGAS